MNDIEKIKRLKSDIEFLKASIESAESYPTENAQFYSALGKQKDELAKLEQELDDLENKPEKSYPKRTNQQNKAIHILFTEYAKALNEAGFDMRKTLKPSIAIPWTGRSVKEFLWKPIQKAQLNKTSTTELTTVEIDEVFDTINRHLGERIGIHIPFPSIDEIILRQEAERRGK